MWVTEYLCVCVCVVHSQCMLPSTAWLKAMAGWKYRKALRIESSYDLKCCCLFLGHCKLRCFPFWGTWHWNTICYHSVMYIIALQDPPNSTHTYMHSGDGTGTFTENSCWIFLSNRTGEQKSALDGKKMLWTIKSRTVCAGKETWPKNLNAAKKG